MGSGVSTTSQRYEENSNTEEEEEERNRSTRKQMIEKIDEFPHNYEAILRDADSLVDQSSSQKLLEQLYVGVFLNQNKQKYWVDKVWRKNCFMLFASDLSITWGKDNRYWHWPLLQESSEVRLPAAELLNICWLEITGKFDASKLSPVTTYEVIFVVMLKDPAYGWHIPVNVKLVLPDGNRQEHKENLMEKARGKWVEIHAGEFVTSPVNNNGEIKFSIYEYENGHWKKGLVVKSVVIRAKA